VTGGNRFAAKQGAPLPYECTKLHRGVAANAGARSLASQIGANKWFKNGVGEFALKILNVERDLQLVSHASCIVCRIKRAATLPPAIHAVRSIMEAHPNPNNLMTSLNKKCCGNRGVHAARECNEHALRTRSLRLRKPPAGKSARDHGDGASTRTPSRIRAQVAAVIAAARRASSTLFVRPKEIRIPPRASSRERPHATSVSDGSREPLMQADPVEIASPA
jgi:hypothetical protein